VFRSSGLIRESSQEPFAVKNSRIWSTLPRSCPVGTRSFRSHFASVLGSILNCVASSFWLTPCPSRCRANASPTDVAGGLGSYPRNRMTLGQNVKPGALRPFDQLATFVAPVPIWLATSCHSRPRSSRRRCRWSPKVLRTLGYPAGRRSTLRVALAKGNAGMRVGDSRQHESRVLCRSSRRARTLR
jgi:hypothetical protein